MARSYEKDMTEFQRAQVYNEHNRSLSCLCDGCDKYRQEQIQADLDIRNKVDLKEN